MRLTGRDVRDHIKHSKAVWWRSYRFYRALRRLKSATVIIREIFDVPRFLSFSTQSANRRHLSLSSYFGSPVIDDQLEPRCLSHWSGRHIDLVQLRSSQVK